MHALCGVSCAPHSLVASYEFRLQSARTLAGIWLEEVAEIKLPHNSQNCSMLSYNIIACYIHNNNYLFVAITVLASYTHLTSTCATTAIPILYNYIQRTAKLAIHHSMHPAVGCTPTPGHILRDAAYRM